MDRTIQPEIQALKNFHILSPVRTTLPNGVPLTVVNAGEQEVVRMDILFAGGRWQQSQKLQALFTNRMLREGTQKYTAATIAEKLDYYGSWLELSSSSEYAYITVYSLNKYLAKTLEVVESMIKEPVFPEKELHTILDTNIQQYLVNTSKVDFLAHRGLLQALYGTQHPCGQIVVEEDYHAITPEVLRDFYGRHYHSGNCSMYVSGKVTPDVVRCIERHWGEAPWGNCTAEKVERTWDIVKDARKRVHVEKEDALQSSLRMGGFSLDRKHPDYLKLRVLVTLFGGYFGSRLMSNIREDKGYTYGIGAGLVSYPGTSLLVVSTEAANEYMESVITEVYHEMDCLRQDKVPAEELEMVRNYMLGDMCRSYEGAFSLSDAWIFIETAGLKPDFFDASLAAIREVTSDELLSLAQRYFCKENLIEVVAGKKV